METACARQRDGDDAPHGAGIAGHSRLRPGRILDEVDGMLADPTTNLRKIALQLRPPAAWIALSNPPVNAVALAAAVGQKRAAELVLTAKTITGREAAAMGLANAAGDPTTLAEESVKRISALSPAALALSKKVLYSWDAIHFDKGLAR